MNIATSKLNPRAEAGNTFLELLITLSILSLFFAVSLPSLARLFQHHELDASARRLVTDVRGAQMSAWSYGDVQEISLYRFKPQYQLWNNGQYVGQVTLPDTLQYQNGYLEPTVATMRFDPGGKLTGGGTIRLLNKLREGADINIYLNSGVVVYEGVHP